MTPLDGNAIAGMLRTAYGQDMTTAVGTCAGCQQPSLLGETSVYHGAGTVLHCPGCGAVMMTIVDHGDMLGIDAQGMSAMRFPDRTLRGPTS